MLASYNVLGHRGGGHSICPAYSFLHQAAHLYGSYMNLAVSVQIMFIRIQSGAILGIPWNQKTHVV